MNIRQLGLVTPLALTLLCLAHDAGAQSMYLQRGTSGFGVRGGLMGSDDWTGLGVGFGYSIVGLVDIGFDISHVGLDDSDLSANGVSPSISYCALKQSQDVPLSLEIGFASQHDSYDSDGLDDLGWDMSGTTYSLGAEIYSSVGSSPSMEILPTLGLAYVHTDIEIEDSFGDTVSAEDSSAAISLGVSLAFPRANERVFHLTPSVTIIEDNASFQLAAGFVFPTHRASSR